MNQTMTMNTMEQEHQFNKRFLNYQTIAGHDIKVVMDDDRKHIVFDIKSYSERHLYFPEFVNLIKQVRNQLGDFGMVKPKYKFEYLSPRDVKATHAIRCIDTETDKAFILMVITDQIRIKSTFTTTYQIFVEFVDWLEKEYLSAESVDSLINKGLAVDISDILLNFKRI